MTPERITNVGLVLLAAGSLGLLVQLSLKPKRRFGWAR